MKITHDHNQTPINSQGTPGVLIQLPAVEGVDRRTAFRIWQMTPGGKTLVELGKLLGMSGYGVSRSISNDRMPVRYYNILVNAGVPSYLLPRPEDVRPGPKPK